MGHRFFEIWRGLLSQVLALYDQKRSTTRFFVPKLFVFFVVVNTACYWFAMATAFPELVFGSRWAHYFRMQFPIGVLSALFELASFYLTVALIRGAVKASGMRSYSLHLTLDFLVDIAIGVLATIWVVMSLSFSSWLAARWAGATPPAPAEIRYVERMARDHQLDPEQLVRQRIGRREIRIRRDFLIYTIQSALLDPGRNWRSWYFGIVMSLSELVPTLMHLLLAFVAFRRARRPAVDRF